MMKRIFSVVATILLLISTVSVSMASGNEITLFGTSATKGNLFDVRIYINGTSDNITIIPEYDNDAFLLYDVKYSGLIENGIDGKNTETGEYQIFFENAGEVKGTVAVLTFMAKESAEERIYTFSATAEGFSVKDGYVRVSENVPGDVNGDETADEFDAEEIKKNSAKWSGYDSADFSNGDVNGDGRVDLADAVIILRASEGWAGYGIDVAREETEVMPLVETDMDEN